MPMTSTSSSSCGIDKKSGQSVTTTGSASSTSEKPGQKMILERRVSRIPAKVPLTDINEFLMCQLCIGYLIEATAIVECQHTFCKSCILKYLETNSYCPICEVQLNEAKPHSSLRSDETLQKLVYKLVPGLFVTEVRQRREFLAKFLGDDSRVDSIRCISGSALSASAGVTSNGGGAGELSDILSSMELKEGDEDLIFLSPEDSVSLSLEYFKSTTNPVETISPPVKPAVVATPALKSRKPSQDSATEQPKPEPVKKPVTSSSTTITISDNKANDRRYLQCPAAVSVGLLKKFIRMKYGLSDDYRVELLYNGDRDNNLESDLTLLDLAFIFKWKKADPMCFHYRIFDRPFKSTTTRPGSKRSIQSMMDEDEPPNDDDTASGPPNRSSMTYPTASKLARFSSADGHGKTSSSDAGSNPKGQPKTKTAMLQIKDEDEKKVAVLTPAGPSLSKKEEPRNSSMAKVEPSPIKSAEEFKIKNPVVEPKPSVSSTCPPQPVPTPTLPAGGPKLTPKVPPLIVSSPTRDPGSPLKISLGLGLTSSKSSVSSSSSPEGKVHHHHHHHKHHRHHHKDKHRSKHGKSKSKDKDKDRSSSKSKDKDKKKGQWLGLGQSPVVEPKEKEPVRYKYNAHPNPSQSQTISVKKVPNSGPNVGLTASATAAGPGQNSGNVSIGRLESGLNKKGKNGTVNSAGNPGPGMVPAKKNMPQLPGPGSGPISKNIPSGIPERRTSSSSTTSSSSQASLTTLLKAGKLPSVGSNMMSISKEIVQQQQQRSNMVQLPDSVHLQVPKSVTLIPVNPGGSGQLAAGKRIQAGQAQGSGGRNPQTFTHPITNKSLHQITVTEVPPPASGSRPSNCASPNSSNASGPGGSLTIKPSTGNLQQLHKQFNGPGSMEITKIYCDKSSSGVSGSASAQIPIGSSSKVFDHHPQGKKLKGLDISISTGPSSSSRKLSFDSESQQQQQQQQLLSKNSVTVSKTTGLPKIPGVSILPQKNLGNSMSISATTGGVGRIKEKNLVASNRLSITTIGHQQQQPLKIPMSKNVPGNIPRLSASSSSMAAPTSNKRSLSPSSDGNKGIRLNQNQNVPRNSRVSPSPPNSGGSKNGRRSSIEITPVQQTPKNKIKRPFETSFPRNNSISKSGSPSSPPGKRDKVGSNNKSNTMVKKSDQVECPLDLSGKSSRSTPPSSSDYDSSNSSFSMDRPLTPNTAGAGSSPNHKPNAQKFHSKSQSKSHGSNMAHGTQTISVGQKSHQQQHKESKMSSNSNRNQHLVNNHHGSGSITLSALSPPIMAPMAAHSPPGGPGFHPLGNLLTLSNAAAHLRKMNHHNHSLNNLAVAAANATGGFCPNMLRAPGILQQQSPSSSSSSTSSPPISPNSLNNGGVGIPAGLLSHFNHHKMSMTSLMNSPLMMNTAASLLDPTSPASLFCARMGFPQPTPGSPLTNPYFSGSSALTRPPHPSAASSLLRIPSVAGSKLQQQLINHTKSQPIGISCHVPQTHFPSNSSQNQSKNSNSGSKNVTHSPKSSSNTTSSPTKPLKLNGVIPQSITNTFVAPSSITPMSKAQVQSAKNAIPNSMKISNFLPTTKSTSSSANTNATITSSCGDLEKLLNDLPCNANGGRHLTPSDRVKEDVDSDHKVEALSSDASKSGPSKSTSSSKKSHKTSTKYLCSPGGIKLLLPTTSSSSMAEVCTLKPFTVNDDEPDCSTLSSSTATTTASQEDSKSRTDTNESQVAVGLGALGVALGLVPRQHPPLLSVPASSSCLTRATQQQNVAVRHIPNPSLIFSRQHSNSSTSSHNNAHNVTPTTTTTTSAQIPTKITESKKIEIEKALSATLDVVNYENSSPPKMDMDMVSTDQIKSKADTDVKIKEEVQVQVQVVETVQMPLSSPVKLSETLFMEKDKALESIPIPKMTMNIPRTMTESECEPSASTKLMESSASSPAKVHVELEPEVVHKVIETETIVNDDEQRLDGSGIEISPALIEKDETIESRRIEDVVKVESETDSKPDENETQISEKIQDLDVVPAGENSDDLMGNICDLGTDLDFAIQNDDAEVVCKLKESEHVEAEAELDADADEVENAVEDDEDVMEIVEDAGQEQDQDRDETEPNNETAMENDPDPLFSFKDSFADDDSFNVTTEESSDGMEIDEFNTQHDFTDMEASNAIMLSVEEMVNQVEDSADVEMETEEEKSIETEIELPNPITIQLESNPIPAKFPIHIEEVPITQNGSTELESLPAIIIVPPQLSPLSIKTTEPLEPTLNNNRPNTLTISSNSSNSNSNSPVPKLLLKSGSCSPASPKPGNNLRKMENLEKVAAGLLVTARNINNNINNSPTSTNCDLTISTSGSTTTTCSLSPSSAIVNNNNSNTNPPQASVSNI